MASRPPIFDWRGKRINAMVRCIMILSDSSNTQISDPSANDIRTVLSSLSDEDTSFAILAESPERFIQAAGTPAGGFQLEYLDDPAQGMMFINDHRLDLDAVVSAFVEFVNKLDTFKHHYAFEKLDAEHIEHDRTYTPLGNYDVYDAKRLLPGLEEAGIRFGFDEEGGKELSPPSAQGIPVFVHRDDEEEALVIRNTVFNISM